MVKSTFCRVKPAIFHMSFLWFLIPVSMVFLWFPMVFPWFSYGFPRVFLWFSHGFPMVFLWFSYGFPMVFLGFSSGFPTVFPWFSYGVPMVFLWPPHFAPHPSPVQRSSPRLADFGRRQGPVAEAVEVAPQLPQGPGIAWAKEWGWDDWFIPSGLSSGKLTVCYKNMVNQWENHRKTMGKRRFILW